MILFGSPSLHFFTCAKPSKKSAKSKQKLQKESANKQTGLIEAAAPPASDVDRLWSSRELRN